MYGYIQWTETVRRPVIMEKEIMRVRFHCVLMPKRRVFLQKKMISRAAALLNREGVIRAVFPEEFPWLELFAGEHIQPVDPIVLYRAVAAELVQYRLMSVGERGKGIAVAVCASGLTDEVRRTVVELCVRNRYVMLFTPGRNDEFCRKIRREYGVPLVQTEDLSQLAKVSVILRFSPEPDCGDSNRCIDLFSGAAPPREILRLADDRESLLPVDCDRMQLLSALYYAGALRRGDFRIFAPDLRETMLSGGKNP